MPSKSQDFWKRMERIEGGIASLLESRGSETANDTSQFANRLDSLFNELTELKRMVGEAKADKGTNATGKHWLSDFLFGRGENDNAQK